MLLRVSDIRVSDTPRDANHSDLDVLVALVQNVRIVQALLLRRLVLQTFAVLVMWIRSFIFRLVERGLPYISYYFFRLDQVSQRRHHAHILTVGVANLEARVLRTFRVAVRVRVILLIYQGREALGVRSVAHSSLVRLLERGFLLLQVRRRIFFRDQLRDSRTHLLDESATTQVISSLPR